MDNFLVRVLLIEDEAKAEEAARVVIESLNVPVDITVARNRDEAKEAVNSNFFDLVLLDLNIPSSSTSADCAPEHGYAVFGHAREAAPGTPICLLTASSVEPFASDLLQHSHQINIWGPATLPTVKLQKKMNLDALGSELLPYLSAAGGLADTELSVTGEMLEIADDRLIRIFVSQHQCVRCDVSRMGGGLSGTRVYRLVAFNASGAPVHAAVAKIGSIEDVRDERDRYNGFVARLTPGITPRLLACYEFGAKATGAIFYGLAAGHVYSFFQLAKDFPGVCQAAVQNTDQGLSAWRDGSREGRRTVAEVRATLVSDQVFLSIKEKLGLDWIDEFERRPLQVKWGCVHSDFHGENVLLTSNGTPAVIDYGDVKEAAASIDPVTLEFSALFHPNSPWRGGAWPTPEIATHWGDLSIYLEGCPYPDFIRACREWAARLSAGQREIAASAYAYLVRQLKYEGVDPERVRSLLIGARRVWGAT